MTAVTSTASQERPIAPKSAAGFAFSTLVERYGLTRMLVGMTAAVGILFALSDDDGPVLCPFRRCTGGYCPGCGLTRSGGRLLRGDVAGSWQQHPYLVIGLTQAAAIGAMWRFGSPRLREHMKALGYRALMANLALMTLIWVARLVDGSIPIPFAN